MGPSRKTSLKSKAFDQAIANDKKAKPTGTSDKKSKISTEVKYVEVLIPLVDVF